MSKPAGRGSACTPRRRRRCRLRAWRAHFCLGTSTNCARFSQNFWGGTPGTTFSIRRCLTWPPLLLPVCAPSRRCFALCRPLRHPGGSPGHVHGHSGALQVSFPNRECMGVFVGGPGGGASSGLEHVLRVTGRGRAGQQEGSSCWPVVCCTAQRAAGAALQNHSPPLPPHARPRSTACCTARCWRLAGAATATGW